MTVEPRELAAHVVPEITEGRLARQWAALESRRPRAASSRTFWQMTGWAVAACGVVYWLWAAPAQRSASRAFIESSETPVAMQLRDGTRLELAAQTRLRVLRDLPEAVEVELAQGSASFDVTHVERRAFSVRAGVVAVRVVGTQFDVLKVTRPEGEEISVSVRRGVVAVERADRGDVRRLTAGEKWSVWVPATPVAASPAPQPAASVEEAHATPSNEPPSAAVAPATGHVVPQHRRPGPTQAAAAPRDARAWFAQASVARRAGWMEEAAEAYAELLKRYPRDARAGLSAFELGRIRMDALGDARGAIEAFSEALRLSRKSQFREDALARLAIAHDSLGEHVECQTVRTRYVTEFPAGVHLATLASLCGKSLP